MTTSFELSRAVHEYPEQAEYWRLEIAAGLEPTVLPRDFLGGAIGRPFATVDAALDAAAVAALSRVTRDDPTLRTAFCAAVLALVAARATDTDKVSMVVPVAGPRGAHACPLTLDVGSGTFRELLSQAKVAYLRASAHADIPVGFLFGQAESSTGDLALSVDEDVDPAEAELFGATLRFAVCSRESQRVRLTYRADLFTSATAERLTQAIARLLGSVTADIDAVLGPLRAADQHELASIEAFNDTAADFPAGTPLHAFLEQRAAGTPDHPAVLDDGTTYGELNRRANQLANTLRAGGVRPGDVVAVCLPRSPAELVAVYAVLKAGAAYLPIDPATPRNRLDYMLAQSGAGVVLGDRVSCAALDTGVTFVDVADPANFIGDGGDLNVEVAPDGLCYVIYTSGSTGRPKGVMIEHRAIVNRLAWMQRAYPLGRDDVVLHKTPFTFDVSVWEIFWWSMAGASVCTLPSGDERDPERIVARIAQFRVSTTHFVPSMLQPFLRFAEASGAVERLASLRTVFSSGEELRAGQVGTFADLLGGPCGTRLVNLYGPTEAAVDVTHFDCSGAEPGRAVPIGSPIDNIRLHILTRAGSVAPIGVPGELCVAGVGVARGYRNSADLTGRRFGPDPEVSGGRLYRTGDLARWGPDGTVEFLGRRDRQVKIRGQRIELAEIEHVAMRAAGVVDCAVLAVSDGTGSHQLHLYVVAIADFHADELRAVLGTELPGYMLPTSIVAVDAIPATANGKRDLAGLPRPVADGGARGFVAPSTKIGQQLAAIWAQVLGVERVGVFDNFFELGGDSIKFIGVLAAASAIDLRFSFQDLFAHPTIAELTELLATAGADQRPERSDDGGDQRPFSLLALGDRERLPSDARDAYPLSMLQAGVLYETARADGARLYHDVVSYLVPDRVDLDAFTAAVESVAQRHAVFRTSFDPTGFAEPLQIVHDSAPVPLQVVDLSGLPRHEQDEELAEFHERELAAGFRTGAIDLVRVRLHLLGERGYYYSLSYHAAALDGWSVNTVNRDVFQTYLALRDGRQPKLAGYELGYQEFVRLEREAVRSPAQREFWQRLLDDVDGTRMPRWPGAVPASRRTVRMHNVALPGGVSDRVIRTAARLGVPLKSVLLAAHVAVLGFVAGTDEVLTGYEHSGRPEAAGGELLPGLFLNTIPLRVRTGGRSWAELVRGVFDAETALLPNRRYPIAEMTRRTGVRGGLFETVFNFTHFHVLKDLVRDHGFELARSAVVSQTGFPFRAEFWQDPFTDEVGLSLHYHQHVFPSAQIEQIAGYYVRALDLLTTRTGEDHRARTLLGDAELALLTDGFAGATRELPDGTMLDLFAQQVRRTPEAIAVCQGSAQLDYQTLAAESDRVAAFLESRGVQHGDVVAVPMERGLAWAVTVLAILKLGAVYLPQEPADPALRRAAALMRCGCRHVLSAAEHADRLAAELTGTSGGHLPVVLSYQDARHAPPRPVAARQPRPADLAYVIFTSGSTGEPKGAAINHLGMLNHLQAKIEDLGLGEGDRIAQVATQCFDISVWQLLAAWLVGGQTVIVPADVVTDLPAFLDLLHDEQVTVVEVVPPYLEALLAEVEARPRPLPSLRHNVVTGESLPPALTARWFASYHVPLVNAYGPTEASDDVTHHVLTGPIDGDRVPVGRPIINTRLYVVGPDDDRLRPIGSFGEICVTGTGVGPGYVNDRAATAAVFLRNHFDDTSPMVYRTGDIGRWLPTGVLDCAGRLDQQVKVRGFRIELTEIESAVTRQPGVEHAAVLVRQSGQEKLIVACYTGAAELELRSLRRDLARRLPDYMLPDAVLRLEALPLTRNGKVDRSALAGVPLAAPAGVRREPPADQVEAEVLGVFADVLDVPADSIGVLDNFFDIGGHSLAAIKIVSRLGGRIALRELLAAPIARSLAERLRDGRPTRRDLLVNLSEAAGRAVEQPTATVVCVPFAGGRAVSYLPFARELHTTGRPVQVLGVELPARTHDDVRDRIPPERLAVELAEEITRTASAELVLLGHSAGSAIALLTALELQRRGRVGTHLVIVAYLPPAPELEDDHRDTGAAAASDEDIMRWLAGTGMAEIDQLGQTERANIATAFRHDSTEAHRVLANALRRPQRHTPRCPTTVVLAADDPVTGQHQGSAARWAALARDVRIVVADGGGHYLNTSRPGLLVACVLDALERRVPDQNHIQKHAIGGQLAWR